MSPTLTQSLESIQTLDGWCSAEKASALASLVLDRRPKLCVELGVFGARSLIAIGLALREVGECGRVWGIDPWTVSSAVEGTVGDANAEWWRSIDIQQVRNRAMTEVTNRGLWSNVSVIVAKSEDCAARFDGIDLLHIDANHSEEKSTLDVHLWAPRVKDEGIILFDDADWGTTQKALADLQLHYADPVRDIISSTGSICRQFRKR